MKVTAPLCHKAALCNTHLPCNRYKCWHVSLRHKRTFNTCYVPSGPAAGTGGAAATELTEARLAALEDNIRDALRSRRSIYEDSKALLVKLFK